MGGKERQHGNFATRVSLAIEERLVLPLAFTMPVTGVLTIWSSGIDLLSSRWLLLGIALYAFAIGYVLFVQTPTVKRVIEMTTMPPGAMAAAATGGESPAPPSGPPPGLPAAVKKIQRGGMLLSVLVVVIVILMVVKPF